MPAVSVSIEMRRLSGVVSGYARVCDGIALGLLSVNLQAASEREAGMRALSIRSIYMAEPWFLFRAVPSSPISARVHCLSSSFNL